MNIYVFAGPSIEAEEIGRHLDAQVLGPAAQGDVYKVVEKRPVAPGIIDGYFEGVPSVWHKEILWALDKGIAVFGASSMGALRAVELHTFGMRGVGDIFNAYKNGTYEDDDEVAVHHGPAELGYVALSEPLVNIRATLDEAVRKQVIATNTAKLLQQKAKLTEYPDRSWDTLLAKPEDHSLPAQELGMLQAWLPNGRIDQKRDDAVAMLKAMAQYVNSNVQSTPVEFHLEWTVMWDKAVRSFDSSANKSDLAERIVDELRLDPERFAHTQRRALARQLTRPGSFRLVDASVDADPREAMKDFRTRHGLFTKAALDEWLHANDLDMNELVKMLAEEQQLAGIAEASGSELNHLILSELRLSGHYVELANKVAEKKSVLEQIRLEDPAPSDTGLGSLQLRAWFFEAHLGVRMPDDLDMYITKYGYRDASHFDQMVSREYLIVREGYSINPNINKDD